MQNEKKISEAIIKRLPRYYRYLSELQSNGAEKVNSSTLAELLNITASQVRQDFYTFGGHGMPGYGYDVAALLSEIAAVLGLNRSYEMIIVGAGRIGLALAAYTGFGKQGFNCRAIFDVDVAGKTVAPSQDLLSTDCLEDYLSSHAVDIAVIATQKEQAQLTADRLVAAGVKAIWNFAPIDLTSQSESVCIENINMSESLFVLAYRMNNKA